MNKEYSIVIDGETVVFEFKDSLIHCEGTATGNIDAIITTTPILPQNLLLDELHIKIPGNDKYLYIYGYGVVENSLKATFNSSSIVDLKKLPESVEVYWGANGEKLIGKMNCRLYSDKVEAELSDEIESSGQYGSDELVVEKTVKEKVIVSEKNNNSSENNDSKKKIMAIVIVLLLLILILYFTF